MPLENRLLLLRHAKTEPAAADDHQRALTDSGRRAAADVGRWLAEQGIAPDHVLVSTATRTRQTWDEVASAAALDVEPEHDDALYAAGPAGALELLNAVPAGAGIVLLIGHNPTVAMLAHSLSDGVPDDMDAFRELSQGYPPAALAVLAVPVPWADLADGTCRLTGFHVGKP